MIKFKKHRQLWKATAKKWEIYTDPGRPSRDDIRNYDKLLKKALKNRRDPNILVLGSTPEIRDLLYKFSLLQNAKIVCVDMTRDMYMAMSELVYARNPRERFVLGNWVDVKFRQKFDAIIGDYVNSNIGKEHKEKYFNNLLSALKPDGYFITRDVYILNIVKINSVADVFNKHLIKVIKGEISLKQSSMWIFDRLLWASWFETDDEKASVDAYESEIAEFGKKLDGASGEERLMKAIYDGFIEVYRSFKGKYWTFYPKAKHEAMLKKFFTIEETRHSNDYDRALTKNSPIYLLKKKQ